MGIKKMFRSFGRSNDKFGKVVQINYRGNKTYGTTFGGYISLCARIFILALGIGQIWACFFSRKYYENEAYAPLDTPND